MRRRRAPWCIVTVTPIIAIDRCQLRPNRDLSLTTSCVNGAYAFARAATTKARCDRRDVDSSSSRHREADVAAALRDGRLKFELKGRRLKGSWTLVRMRGKKWLLVES